MARLNSDVYNLNPTFEKKGLYLGHTVQLSISGMPEAAEIECREKWKLIKRRYANSNVANFEAYQRSI